jgi:hypothetical protein
MSAYQNCRWCGGRGCVACPGEQEKAAQLPEPLILKSAQDIQDARSFIGIEAIDGGDDLRVNLTLAKIRQAMKAGQE